ncbi:unnamed protein product, partial [marine sediment metagenome]
LWPFDHEFYRKYGFENGEKAISYNFKPSNIKSDFKLDDNTKVTDVTDMKDYLPLMQVAMNAKNKYTRVIGDVDAWLLRGELQGGFKIYLFERDDIPTAYISLKFKKVGEWEQNMQILDIAYTDIQAKHSIFAFLRNFEADISKISINLPIQEEVERYLQSIDDTHKFNTWPSMFRILDIKKCFEQIDFLPSLNEELYFQLEDKIISENSGIWKLTIENGKCNVLKLESISADKDNILDLTINQLSQILIGHSNIEKLLEHSNVQIPEQWKNKDLFPEMPCSVMLWF